MASPLTPAVRLQTNAPFPSFCKDEDGKTALSLDPNKKITLESSAEYMHFDMPGSKYGTSADSILLHDLEGQPMVLSIGTDKVSQLEVSRCVANTNYSICIFVPTSMVDRAAGRLSTSLPVRTSKLWCVMQAKARTTRAFSSQSVASEMRKRPRRSYTRSSSTARN